ALYRAGSDGPLPAAVEATTGMLAYEQRGRTVGWLLHVVPSGRERRRRTLSRSCTRSESEAASRRRPTDPQHRQQEPSACLLKSFPLAAGPRGKALGGRP